MAVFRDATFRGDAGFRMATFQSDTVLAGATFQGYALFDKATFQQARQLGPMLVRKSLLLRQAVFHQRAQIEVAAAAVCCQQARFPAGVQLRVRWAQVVLDDADLAAPSILTGAPAFQEVEEGRWARALARLEPADIRASRPRLLSVRRGDVAGLTVAGVDLRACRFAGAHRLDQLRIEESIFASTPKGWRWTTRQTIAEEHHWRAAFSHPDEHDRVSGTASPGMVARGAGWYHSAQWPPAWLDVQPPTPAQTAALYRALRKGREDSKDEPGAADFYYGEMEMRRHDSTKPMGERFVLFLYWLFSGYALRASRALVWLFAVLAVATLLLAAQGLEQPAASWSFPARLGTAALVAVEGAVFRASEQQLTYVGRLIQAALRFAGPILLGLAVLSIRGRVKR
jgi:Pentapeptide repeats (9 copies)